MTDDELDTLSRKHRLRGSILRGAVGLVKTAEDRPAHPASLQRITGEKRLADVIQQADYLAAAGYLERVIEKRAARDEGVLAGYRPTVKGIQLVEGDVTDPSVEFLSLE